MTIDERAKRYIDKMPNAVSGQNGHGSFLAVARALVVGFDMTIEHARPLFEDWNTYHCMPAFDQKQVEHKLRDAEKYKANNPDERGRLLRNGHEPQQARTPQRQEPYDDDPLGFEAIEKTTEAPSLVLGEYIESAIAGKIYACKWPWDMVSQLTRALMPGTITMLSAPPGTSKTFMICEALITWSELYTLSYVALEETLEYYLMRINALIEGNSNLTDLEWSRLNPDQARGWTKNSDKLNKIGKSIVIAPSLISGRTIIKTIKDECDAGKRIIIIDPITAKTPTQKPWIEDHYLMSDVKDTIKKYNTSLVLVTHPSGPQPGKIVPGTKLTSGGAAYERFSQTIMYLSAIDPEPIACSTPMGRSELLVNRKLFLSKTRNGRGQYLTIGFYFDPKTLRHLERGTIAK